VARICSLVMAKSDVLREAFFIPMGPFKFKDESQPTGAMVARCQGDIGSLERSIDVPFLKINLQILDRFILHKSN
jgi:hypothetical protein